MPVTIYPLRISTHCSKGCTRRWLTTRLADIATDEEYEYAMEQIDRAKQEAKR